MKGLVNTDGSANLELLYRNILYLDDNTIMESIELMFCCLYVKKKHYHANSLIVSTRITSLSYSCFKLFNIHDNFEHTVYLFLYTECNTLAHNVFKVHNKST